MRYVIIYSVIFINIRIIFTHVVKIKVNLIKFVNYGI